MKRIWLFLPLCLTIAISILLFTGLRHDPSKLSTPLINQPVPEFSLSDLVNPQEIRQNQDFPKSWYLLNVWGSWCSACRLELPFLMQLAKQQVRIVGLNYRDKRQPALDMLAKMGNPFILNLFDPQGVFALELGVDGAPETYLIDQNGIIRYRHSGLLEENHWQQAILPIIQQLERP